MKNFRKGFTLLEILLVVGIIAVLAGVVIVAINPSKTLATVRNAERKSDLKQIDNALSQYYIDNIRYPTSTESGLLEICNTGSIPYPHIGIDCTGYLDLSVLVPIYLTAIPRDALASTSSSTGYRVYKHSSSRKIQLIASNAELGVVIAIGTTTPSVVEVPVTCTSFTYSTWSACTNSVQSRMALTSSPAGCTGGSPDLSHSCVEGSLQWSSDLGNSMNQYSATAFCADPANNYSRLPTKEELRTAMTDQFVNGGSNPGGFAYETPLWSIYWSSSDASGSVAYVINCGGSNPVCLFGVSDKVEENYVNSRCVR